MRYLLLTVFLWGGSVSAADWDVDEQLTNGKATVVSTGAQSTEQLAVGERDWGSARIFAQCFPESGELRLGVIWPEEIAPGNVPINWSVDGAEWEVDLLLVDRDAGYFDMGQHRGNEILSMLSGGQKLRVEPLGVGRRQEAHFSLVGAAPALDRVRAACQ